MSALTDLFTNIANAIRTKTGSQATIQASDFPTEIANIPSGGGVGGDLDWEDIGYNDVPEQFEDFIEAAYNYAKTIKNNWNPSTTGRDYYGYKELIIFPNDLDTSNLTSMRSSSGMFNSTSLFFVPLMDTSNVTIFAQAFYNCKMLMDASNFEHYDLSKGEDFTSTFNDSSMLKKVTFPNSQITSTSQKLISTFRGCDALEEVDFSNASFSNITAINQLFWSCTKLKKVTFGQNFNTTNCTSFDNLFDSCNNLEEVDLENLNTNSVSTMKRTFYGIGSKIDNLDVSGFNTSNLTSTDEMFGNYQGHIVTLGDNFDCSKVVKAIPFGVNSVPSSLNRIIGAFKNLGKAYTQQTTEYSNYWLILKGSNIDHDDLVNIIDGLYDLNLSYNVAGGGTLYRQRLQLGATNYNKLTAAERQVAIDKGWNVYAN